MKSKITQHKTEERQVTLTDKIVGSIVGAAIGDAIGGATEGWSHEAILEHWGGFVLGPAPMRKQRTISPQLTRGDGRFTDDTLMTHLLIETICELRRHLDAFDLADVFVPKLAFDQKWIPELQQEGNVLSRVFLAEKNLVLKLWSVKNDPREAGVGNAVNCGAAMYSAPIGLINAGRPRQAYDEAVSVFGAHQWSYGREAAGVMAACIAEASNPLGSSIESVLETAVNLSKDGTHKAIVAVLGAAEHFDNWQDAVTSGELRDAIREFDTVGEKYREPEMGAKMPSRTKSIEELPIALAMLKITSGDVRKTILGGTNYGRDADSIASMGGAIAGALGGRGAIPQDWADTVAKASSTDIYEPAEALAQAAIDIAKADILEIERSRFIVSAITEA